MRYRDNLRVGHKQFDRGEKMGLGQKIVLFAGKFITLFLPKYRADYYFTSVDKKRTLSIQENTGKRR